MKHKIALFWWKTGPSGDRSVLQWDVISVLAVMSTCCLSEPFVRLQSWFIRFTDCCWSDNLYFFAYIFSINSWSASPSFLSPPLPFLIYVMNLHIEVFYTVIMSVQGAIVGSSIWTLLLNKMENQILLFNLWKTLFLSAYWCELFSQLLFSMGWIRKMGLLFITALNFSVLK